LLPKQYRETKGAKVAELKKEEAYWREQHAKQPYADKNLGYEHYAPAYRTGIEAAQKYPGKRTFWLRSLFWASDVKAEPIEATA